jgi:predicted RNA-binding protein with PUA-like domain
MLAAAGITTALADEWAHRSISRDISWGIPLPPIEPALAGKTLYVWPDSLIAPMAFTQVALAAKGQTVAWTGVRNYQARNFMRDQMQIGDGVLFYHSGCAEPGIAGIAEVASTCYPDPTQFDRKSPYYDSKASPDNPRWLLVDVRALKKIQLIGLPALRAQDNLADMLILRRGNRLSITPVTPAEWRHIIGHMAAKN